MIMKKLIMIEGMRCEHCAAKIRKALDALGNGCEVDLEKKQAVLDTDKSDEELKQAVEEKGFHVVSIF